MRLDFWRAGAYLVLVLAVCLGCGGGEEPSKSDARNTSDETPAEAPADGAIKKISTSKLPPLGDALPALDGGRVDQLAPPKGWDLLPRDNKYVARFATKKTNPNDLPRILVTVEPASDFTDDVTGDNVAEFAQSLADDKKYLESPKPMLIGDNAYARYVTQAKKGSRTVERQFLETVFDGRRYAVVLEVFAEDLLKNRDLAYAVAAGIKYTAPGGSTPQPMTDEKKAE